MGWAERANSRPSFMHRDKKYRGPRTWTRKTVVQQLETAFKSDTKVRTARPATLRRWRKNRLAMIEAAKLSQLGLR